MGNGRHCIIGFVGLFKLFRPFGFGSLKGQIRCEPVHQAYAEDSYTCTGKHVASPVAVVVYAHQPYAGGNGIARDNNGGILFPIFAAQHLGTNKGSDSVP